MWAEFFRWEGMVRIELTTEGGFVAAPGLEKPVVLESSDLPADECTACEALVREAVADKASGDAPSTPVMRGQVRDGRSYHLKIDIDGRSYSLKASDLAMSPAYRELLKLVRTHGSR
jgi:hypothetical protein